VNFFLSTFYKKDNNEMNHVMKNNYYLLKIHSKVYDSVKREVRFDMLQNIGFGAKYGLIGA